MLIPIDELILQFAQMDHWEECYRTLIQLGKKLPEYDEATRLKMQKIEGCEVEVRFFIEKNGSEYQFSAYSEARIMNGLLYLLLSAIQHLTLPELQQFDFSQTLQKCSIASRLSETRLNGLKNIETLLHQLDQ